MELKLLETTETLNRYVFSRKFKVELWSGASAAREAAAAIGDVRGPLRPRLEAAFP